MTLPSALVTRSGSATLGRMSTDEEKAKRIAAATRVFDKDVGTWDSDSEIFPGPGAAPIRQRGVYENRWAEPSRAPSVAGTPRPAR